MIVETTINGDLKYNDKLEKGIVIFPETEKDVKTIKKLKKFLKTL